MNQKSTNKQRSSSKHQGKLKYIERSESEENSSDAELGMHTVTNGTSSPPITVQVLLNGKEVLMEVDTGATISIIAEAQAKKIFPEARYRESDVVLKTYTAEELEVRGEIDVEVQYQKQKQMLTLVVVAGNGPALLGRNWLNHITLDWSRIAHTTVGQCRNISALLSKYPSVFTDKLGTMTRHRAKLHVRESVRPRFCKPRPVPYALQPSVEKELDRLQA